MGVGAATLAFGPRELPSLRKLAFPGSSLTVPAGTAAPSGLTDFGVTDALVLGAMDGPWLPTSTTTLYVSNARLQRLPGVVSHLTNLRRQDLHAAGGWPAHVCGGSSSALALCLPLTSHAVACGCLECCSDEYALLLLLLL
jgi:hypothetical protein